MQHFYLKLFFYVFLSHPTKEWSGFVDHILSYATIIYKLYRAVNFSLENIALVGVHVQNSGSAELCADRLTLCSV